MDGENSVNISEENQPPNEDIDIVQLLSQTELIAAIKEKGWVVVDDASRPQESFRNFIISVSEAAKILELRELSHPLLAIWDVDPWVGDCGTSTYYERCKLAFHNLRSSRVRVAAAYNRGQLPVNVSVNDTVMCRTFPLSSAAYRISAKLTPRISAKLTPRWSSPWRISSFLTPVFVHLKLVEAEQQSHRAHSNAMREEDKQVMQAG
uniref:Uncharacterized protein n=1 Tax=Timema cristinae TaxID=61476 RepID=A0A7R9HCP8_TIMCR|nr:unnamed protein product [Timema cristinae]